VDLLDEPKGWRMLQTLAQNEKDPQRLEAIIHQMNRLLDQHERTSATRKASGSKPLRSAGKRTGVGPEFWELEA
jgi:hypothetical protein